MRVEVGDTEFLVDEQVDKFRFMEENERVIMNNGRPATAQPMGRLIPAGTGFW